MPTVMKYHYKIVSSFDPTDIHSDSKNFMGGSSENAGEFEGFKTDVLAEEYGESELKRNKLNPEEYYVKVYPATK